MPEILLSSKSLTEEFARRIQNESVSSGSTLAIGGKTNLLFRPVLASATEEGMKVFEAYLKVFQSNGEAIKMLGVSLDGLDSQGAMAMK